MIFRLPLATIFIGALLLISPVFAKGFFGEKHFPIITDETFTADEFILDQAKFWFAIYTDVDVDEGLIHDPFYPDMVFRKVKAAGSGRVGNKAAEAQVNQVRNEINTLFSKDSTTWTDGEKELRSRFPAFWDSTAIRLSLERLRFQRGLKSKFLAGLERSYRYLPLIDSTLAKEGVPARLKYLPHVESSFYPYAYSKVGAAGMWQFMKGSARLYKVPVGYLVDNRRDPEASSKAAAQMLAHNFSVLKSWPLAIVAYNHGPGGVANAARETGTRDLGTIIKSYYSNSFGFASKNFYSEFLAASSIAMQADSLFPNHKKMEPLQSQTLVLSKAVSTRNLCAMLGISPVDLEEYNLGLRPATFKGNTTLPKGYGLHLPLQLNASLVAGKLGTLIGAKLTNVSKMDSTTQVAMAEKAPEKVVSQDKVENVEAVEKPVEKELPKKAAVKKIKEPKIGEPQNEVVAKISEPVLIEKSPQKVVTKAEPKTEPLAVVKEKMPEIIVPEKSRVLDTTLALQSSDIDKLAHPMDRFNPAIYNLQSNYENGVLTIQVGTEETISHYSEWAGVSESSIKKTSQVSGKGLRLGQRIRIQVNEDKAFKFLKSREEYYRAMEEDFYSNYYVSVVEPLIVEKGLNLWTYTQEKEIPLWLIQKHNMGKSLNNLHPGDTLGLPIIETGVRKWGFTRYANTQEYLAGIEKYLRTGKPESY